MLGSNQNVSGSENPNVDEVARTLSGDEMVVAGMPIKHFYASILHGNSTEFFPHNII